MTGILNGRRRGQEGAPAARPGKATVNPDAPQAWQRRSKRRDGCGQEVEAVGFSGTRIVRDLPSLRGKALTPEPRWRARSGSIRLKTRQSMGEVAPWGGQDEVVQQRPSASCQGGPGIVKDVPPLRECERQRLEWTDRRPRAWNGSPVEVMPRRGEVSGIREPVRTV